MAFSSITLNSVIVLGLQDTEASVRNAIRHNILNLLLSTLHQPSPNLAQFLLGFDLQTGVSKTVFQDAGELVIQLSGSSLVRQSRNI